MWRRLFFSAFVMLLGRVGWALGPHEVLVLINERSPDSIEVAKEFVRLRRVPEINLVRLALPQTVMASPAQISAADFARLIWLPAMRHVREAGIEDHILAWVYSVDFPVAIEASGGMSMQGLTLLRGRLPDAETVSGGTYTSPLFAGPDPQEGIHMPQTFDAYREWLRHDMPLPSMMLGFIGKRGTTVKTVIECLGRGARSDGTAPSGTVYLVTSEDVRSRCRAWQFPGTRQELAAKGVACVVTDRLPEEARGVLGVMMGAADVTVGKGLRFVPGSMAEHLTSGAAVFDSPIQTKLNAWIDAGATASAGTVSEPFSNWKKFPSSRFFVYYASGCSMIESFFQSVRCPLQILLVGDPLANPWAMPGRIELSGVAGPSVSGTVTVRAVLQGVPEYRFNRRVFLVDGRVVGRDPTLRWDSQTVEDGVHRLRVVAYSTGLVRQQLFAERELKVENRRP